MFKYMTFVYEYVYNSDIIKNSDITKNFHIYFSESDRSDYNMQFTNSPWYTYLTTHH